MGARRDTRQRRIRALSTAGQVAGAATNNVELAAHRLYRPAHPRLPTKPHHPEARCSRRDRTTVPSPDNAFTYVKNRSLRELLAHHGIRHLTTEPYRPRTNGKVERFHQTMSREWAHGVSYRTHRHRNQALPHWLNHYNRTRPHSSPGDRPPISRVHNVRG
ncbi:MAG: transposase [Actinobacteria bacterium]|nr:transposase [Actinomycetota bacterium]